MIIPVTKDSVSIIGARVKNLPMDGTWEVDIRAVTKQRSKPQNARMWADLVTTITDQAMVDGRKYKQEVWHEYLKKAFLPEMDDEEIARKVKPGYRKWDIGPDGEKILIGSTTKLTTFGMTQYMQEIEAWAATELGVMFVYRG